MNGKHTAALGKIKCKLLSLGLKQRARHQDQT